MTFEDEEIEKLDLTNADDVARLITEYLCGEKNINDKNNDIIQSIKLKKNSKLNYQQFNELLLLLNQDRVSEDFFEIFFGKANVPLEDLTISLSGLKEGVKKFRGFAMLCYGNFRFAYKELIKKRKPDIEEKLKPYWKKPEELSKKFEGRPLRMLNIQHVKRDETWYIGDISGRKFEKERDYLDKCLASSTQDKMSKLLPEKRTYEQMEKTINKVEREASRNTNIYLTWDYMDVYIATSMRNKWEFQEVYDFINGVFKKPIIKELNLRCFDPTQSKCEDRIDKGLIEGLMLKRVKCCIYMAQESDTMGKDSELAATLAQGKPVIAYIRRINIDRYSKKIEKYPLDYFEKRLLILMAEEIFDDEKCIDEFEKHDEKFSKEIGCLRKKLDEYRSSSSWEKKRNNFEKQRRQRFLKKIERFQKELDKYRDSQPFTLWEEKEKEFKEGCDSFSDICKILAIAEHYHFERRANTLKNIHPLAIQVDLKSGVANGVLVVRSIGDCANLLYQILTNKMEFKIEHRDDEGITVLEEKVSGCPFRVVTDDEKLTNSFWNFYLTSD